MWEGIHPAVQNVDFDKGSTFSHHLVVIKCIPDTAYVADSGITMTKQWHPSQETPEGLMLQLPRMLTHLSSSLPGKGPPQNKNLP